MHAPITDRLGKKEKKKKRNTRKGEEKSERGTKALARELLPRDSSTRSNREVRRGEAGCGKFTRRKAWTGGYNFLRGIRQYPVGDDKGENSFEAETEGWKPETRGLVIKGGEERCITLEI